MNNGGRPVSREAWPMHTHCASSLAAYLSNGQPSHIVLLAANETSVYCTLCCVKIYR